MPDQSIPPVGEPALAQAPHPEPVEGRAGRTAAALSRRTVETARLMLRPAQVEDAPEIFERYAQDPEVTRYLTWSPHTSVAETRRFLRACERAWRDDAAFPWVITRREDNEILGMIGLHPSGHMAMVGYVIARPEWGKGYATEALRAVIDLAFSIPGVYRVWAVCDVENPASARVMEKAGMAREGVLRRLLLHPAFPEPLDAYCYAKTR